MSEGTVDRIRSAAWYAATTVPIWFRALVTGFIWGHLIGIAYLLFVARDSPDDARVGIHVWVIAGLLAMLSYLRLRRREQQRRAARSTIQAT